MKRLMQILLVFIFLTTCKKNNSTDNNTGTPPPTDTSFIKTTGLISSTDVDLQNIPDVATIDTSLIPSFGRIGDLPPSTSISIPSPGNQGSYNSCVGWAVGYGMLGYQFKVIEGHSDYNGNDKNFSPNYIWNQLNGGANVGVSFSGAMNLVVNQGCCKFIDMPINVAPNIQPSSTAIANAANYKLTQFFRFFTIDINKMKAWLSKGYPIMVAVKIDHAFMKNDASPFEKQADGRYVWKSYQTSEREGHALLICGYDNAINSFKVLNSWGSNWGNSGYIWIDYDFFKTAVANTIGLAPEIYIGIIKRPILSTTSCSAITQTNTQSGGIISSDWGVSVTSRGVCWSTSQDPNIAGNKTNDGTGKGSFVSNISGLTANTTYYLKAYATNSSGTSYGTEITFTTANTPTLTLPTITTTAVSSITQTTAQSGGSVTSDGNATVTARGICWSTSANPTTANSKTTDGNGTGSFTSSLTGLTANTIYNVRAYATNSAGTAYGSNISFTTSQTGGGTTVTDIDGNVYHTVAIGTQVWMVENLNVTHYRNGDTIPQVTYTNQTAWGLLSTGAWCYYDNFSENGAVYGKLYNWYAVNDPRGLAPAGWHVPSDAEWTTLSTCLGGEPIAGGPMKEIGTTHWAPPNTGATNTSGFTGLPGGLRDANNSFFNVGNYGNWWSSTELSTGWAWTRFLDHSSGIIYRFNYLQQDGNSVRCLRD
jgi:uncharacterized protein (TIGR02145 family)